MSDIQGGPKNWSHSVMYLLGIRQMAPLLYTINFGKLHFNVKNEATFCKNRIVDLSV